MDRNSEGPGKKERSKRTRRRRAPHPHVHPVELRRKAVQLCVEEGFLLEDLKPQSVLLLGATPEIRDLLYELKIENRVVVDIDPMAYDEMSTIRKHADDREEKFMEANWLSLPLKEKFEVIMADLPSMHWSTAFATASFICSSASGGVTRR